MQNSKIGNYEKHARFWDWGNIDYDRSHEDQYWLNFAKRYGNNVLIPMCALGESGAYMADRGMNVTAFDIIPEMISEGKKRFGEKKGLQLFVGDVRDFCFDIAPVDFCFTTDFGHLHSINELKKAISCVYNQLRAGGCLVIETTLPSSDTYDYPQKKFMPSNQAYPGLTVWKTGEGRVEAETGRHYIVQRFFTEDETGHIDSFDHEFYLQSYSHADWSSVLTECGFEIIHEYRSRDSETWQSGSDTFLIIEAVKA